MCILSLGPLCQLFLLFFFPPSEEDLILILRVGAEDLVTPAPSCGCFLKFRLMASQASASEA